jgi:hypothetical protein
MNPADTPLALSVMPFESIINPGILSKNLRKRTTATIPKNNIDAIPPRKMKVGLPHNGWGLCGGLISNHIPSHTKASAPTNDNSILVLFNGISIFSFIMNYREIKIIIFEA